MNDTTYFGTSYLEDTIKLWRMHKSNHYYAMELASLFYTLAKNVIKYCKFPIEDDKAHAVAECIKIAFDKSDRFNCSKGKAFNFFTTVMLGHLRQLYRTKKNLIELKRQKGLL